MASKRDQLLEQLSAYLDGELSDAERTKVEAFVSRDPEARQLLSELRAMTQELHGLPRAKASDRLLEGVRTRLERRALLDGRGDPAPAASSARAHGWRWVAAAAVIALAFVTLYLVRQQRHPWMIADA